MPAMIPFNSNSFGFDNIYNRLDNLVRGSYESARNFFADTFRLDVKEDEKSYEIEAEMPGIKKEEVTLTMDEGTLRIVLSREETEDDEKENDDDTYYIHKERRFASASREIYLPDAETEGITAKMENGILKIVIPKLPEIDESKKIEID